MANPPNNSISALGGLSETNGAVGKNNELTGYSEYIFNIPPAVPALSFQATYDGTNDRIGLPDPHSTTSQYVSRMPFNPTSYPASGPRRGSFPDILPHGHTPPPPIIDSNLNFRGGMFDLSTGANSAPDDVQTDSDPDFRYSAPSSRMGPPPRSVANAEPADNSTITVMGQGDISHAVGDVKTPTTAIIKTSGSRRNKQYVLPDGSVVSGKGLGRGRPGIKRGPRNQKPQTRDESSPQVASVDSMNTPSHDPEVRTKKQNSVASENSIPRASTSNSDDSASSESSDEYNPTAHTRFGRQTQKPASLTNPTAASASPSAKLTRNNSTANATSNSPASVKIHPKIKRRVYRGREQFALCEHCLRGYGPLENVIVFCDACNKCWHQRCHEPQISKQTVADSKAEWYCIECDRILHGKKKDKKTQSKTNSQPALIAPPVAQQAPTYTGPHVGGRFLTPDQKLSYLNTLSKDNLVSLLLQASDLAPDLPVFQTLAPPPPPPVVMPQAQFTSTYVTPVSKKPSFVDNDVGDDDEVDEGYDGYFDEHAALYPKPGHGVRLPPESEDLHMLLEGKDSRTFSHWISGLSGIPFSGTGNISSTRY